MIDLDAYFERIGWRGARTATLDTLSGLVDAHMTAIPFENLDVLLRRPPKLDLASLQAKLVGARRGGYCYEHATLFAAVLDELGFTVARHSARVTMRTPRAEAPRTHMFLSVALPEGTFVVDPGFGGLAPRTPVNVDGTPAGDHQLVREPDHHALVVRMPDRTLTAWVSSLEHDFPIDFEMANYFTATNPLSPFTRMIMMRAFTSDGKVTVMNRVVTHTRSGVEHATQIATGAELRGVVREHFGFDLPELDGLELPA